MELSAESSFIFFDEITKEEKKKEKKKKKSKTKNIEVAKTERYMRIQIHQRIHTDNQLSLLSVPFFPFTNTRQTYGTFEAQKAI